MKTPADISARIEQTRAALAGLAADPAPIRRAIDLVLATYRAGGKVLICGNGGSAGEAQHISAELVSRMCFDRAPLPAIALATDNSIVTAIANDYSYNVVFSKQVQAYGRPGDLLWALSTSGRSENIILALRTAGELGMKRLGMTGRPGSAMEPLCELCLGVDSPVTAVVQEAHLCLAHIICAEVESELFGGGHG
jgi:D-sedoheptulose 7-phosphate isomerase